MGSVSFAQHLFDKVFRDDIIRLRSMEEMWKSRRPPEPLDFQKLAATALEAKERKDEILKNSQKVWTLEENLVVFHESLEMLSKRMEEMKVSTEEDGPSPTIEFDKDDEDTLNFVTASANIRSLIFGIEPKSKFDTKQMAGNIIPAIATTNAIVAGLCVLQSFKVLKGEFSNTKEVCLVSNIQDVEADDFQVFLSPFTPERLLSSDRMGAPNPDCPVCSVTQTRIQVDIEKTTLKELIEGFLRSDLGYGEELVVNHDTNLLYDVEETDNLDSTLSALGKFCQELILANLTTYYMNADVQSGINYDSFLTIIDEEDDSPRVNLVLSIQKPYVLYIPSFHLQTHNFRTSDSDKSITALDLKPSSDAESITSAIPRRPKKPTQANGHAEPVTNGINGANGHKAETVDLSTSSKKRTADESLDEDVPALKKSKVEKDGAISIDDSDNGAIVIDDD